MVIINPFVWDFIPANARAFKEEVYGWLLGYSADNGEPVILGAYDCQKFVEQTLISAHADEKMFHEIAVSLPNGIGVIGVYHSHPAASNIFHSHIDDSTVLNFIKMASNFISVVTNGSDVQCFMLVDKAEGNLKKIEPQLKLAKLPPSTRLRVNLNVRLFPGGSQVKAHNITSQFADMFHNNWAKRRYLLPSTKKNLEEQTLLSKIPDEPSLKSRLIEVDLGGMQEKTSKSDSGIRIQGKLELELFHKEKETIAQADQNIRNAILNQLNQRILKGQLDPVGKSWTLAPGHEIRLWNIPLDFVFSLYDAQHECEEFLNGMVQRINYISPEKVKQDSTMREQLSRTIGDLEKLATIHQISSQKDVLNQLKKKLT